jgi:hypothetical protein
MRKVIGVAGVVTAACALGLATPQGASAARLARVGTFNAPTFVTAPRSATPGTFFVVERAGRVIRSYKGSRNTFANISDRVSCCVGERGLASMAFDPGWSSNRRVYFFYTNNNGDLVVARYRANSGGTRIVESSFHRMLLVEHTTHSNHNGGQLAFGPDGMLYVGTGDGGGGCDPFEAAQKLSSRLGKILRINPSTGAISIFMYGVRNPWRFSFDRGNGSFWLGDVGQGTQEEVDFRSASQLGCDGAGLNNTGTLVRPFAVYGHTGGNCSITGGYVYRGQKLSFRGWYVYGDYCTGNIWRIRRFDGRLRRVLIVDSSANVSSFGESVRGELYVADLGGVVYRLVPSS